MSSPAELPREEDIGGVVSFIEAVDGPTYTTAVHSSETEGTGSWLLRCRSVVGQLQWCERCVIIFCLVFLVFFGFYGRHIQPAEVTEVFHLRLATAGLRLSKIAYCPSAQLEVWNCTACHQPDMASFSLRHLYTNASHYTLGYSGVWTTHRAIVVAFRGSSNYENWLENLKFLQTPYPHCASCAVHTGFYNSLKDVQHHVRRDVAYLLRRYPHYQVWVTGHSLGGALATLSALDLVSSSRTASSAAASTRVEELIPVGDGEDSSGSGVSSVEETGPQRPVVPSHKLHLYTFGAPRVGNVAFAEWGHLALPHSYRLTHNRDAVPHVPPHNYGYRHLPREVWFDNDSEPLTFVVCNDTAEESELCSYGMWGTTIADHVTYLGTSTTCDE